MLKKYFKIILNIIFNFEMDHSDLKYIRRVCLPLCFVRYDFTDPRSTKTWVIQ